MARNSCTVLEPPCCCSRSSRIPVPSRISASDPTSRANSASPPSPPLCAADGRGAEKHTFAFSAVAGWAFLPFLSWCGVECPT
eukprot:903309-Rhodomonas_salina.2